MLIILDCALIVFQSSHFVLFEYLIYFCSDFYTYNLDIRERFL
jgi:hypothetical protein